MKLAVVVLGVLSTVGVGCMSGAPVPADKLSRAQAAVRSAQEMGAERNAEGAGHLQAAKSELARGRKLVIDGDQERATTVLLAAEADAELAMNLTREATALADAQKTRDQVRDLRTSMKGGN